jgi:hypothetical protein
MHQARPLRSGRTNVKNENLPTLSTDGSTVVFSSLETFREHYRAYIRHGAILVAAPPIDVGTRRGLTLRIDELAATYHVHAVVQYRTSDAVGFAIERFADHKVWLRSIAEEIE